MFILIIWSDKKNMDFQKLFTKGFYKFFCKKGKESKSFFCTGGVPKVRVGKTKKKLHRGIHNWAFQVWGV